jgi:hypothetical protein
MLYRITCLLFLLFFHMLDVSSETCPTPEKIRERNISKQYEWTVQEGVTLDNLLSVQRLYAVRIINFDDYISCRYTTGKWPVKLDGKPVNNKCHLLPDAGEWRSTDSGSLVCQEKDPVQCGFSMDCK